MSDRLEQISHLGAKAWLLAPEDPHPIDPVLRWTQVFESFVRSVGPSEPLPLQDIYSRLDGLFPDELCDAPVLVEHHDVLWIAGSGVLFDGQSGLAVPGSMLTRFPRHRQTPYAVSHWVELTRPLSSFQRLQHALWLPHADCQMFGHFMTEILAFLWPIFTQEATQLTGWPVLLPGCDSTSSLSDWLFRLLRSRHLYPLLRSTLPKAVHLQRVLIPQPSMRLHAGTSTTFLQSAQAFGDWLLCSSPVAEMTDHSRVFLSRSALHEDCRKIEGERELEQYLKQSGWLIVHPEQEELPQQVALIRAARCIAAFDGSALHGLAWLGDHAETMLILLGDSPSLDYWLQFRAQKIRGWFLSCTQPFADEKPSHLQNRQLTLQARDLSETIDALALVET